MSRDLADLARSVAQTPEALQRGALRGVTAASLYVTREIRDEIRGVTGDMRLSGVGRRGARVGAKYDVKGTGGNPSVLITATGPIQLIERDTAPHEMRPRRRRGAKALRLPDGSFYAHVQHPGTRGKHPFEHGAERGGLRSTEKFNAAVEKELMRVWT